MGYITLGMLVFTLLTVGFGAFWGMVRGRNRAVLRFIIIIACLLLALLARGVITNAVMGIEIKGMDVVTYISQMLNEGETQMPEAVVNMVVALVKIIISLMVFMLSFITLSGLSMILFWILKIFVKPGEQKRRGLGAIIGTVQGVLVAFIIAAPLTGIMMQVDKVSQIRMNGEQIVKIPEEVGLSQFAQSGVGKFFDSTGGWFFDALASAKDANGEEVSLNDTVDAVTTVAGVADSLSQVTESMGTITSSEATTTERAQAMKEVGQSFKEVGQSMDNLDDDTKELINDIISSVAEMFEDESDSSEGEASSAITEFLKDLDVSKLDFGAIGGAMEGMANYMESQESSEDGKTLTQEDVNNIVNGFAKNTFILDMFKDGDDFPQMIEVAEEHQAMFKTAINNTNLSQEYKDLLYKLFGLTK